MRRSTTWKGRKMLPTYRAVIRNWARSKAPYSCLYSSVTGSRVVLWYRRVIKRDCERLGSIYQCRKKNRDLVFLSPTHTYTRYEVGTLLSQLSGRSRGGSIFPLAQLCYGNWVKLSPAHNCTPVTSRANQFCQHPRFSTSGNYRFVGYILKYRLLRAHKTK